MVKEGHSPSMKTLVASVFLIYPSDGWASASEWPIRLQDLFENRLDKTICCID
jgi:hypothetical protein